MAEDPNARDAKLIQYLNEAYGKEKQLETALEAHIQMATRPPYKKRLQQHLKETKSHAREVERRIKKLGGKAEVQGLPGPGQVAQAASKVVEVGQRAAAAAQGPLHAVRGTGEAEKMLKNAKTEYQDEHEEIALYQALEIFAEAVGDKETAKLAKQIRRDEEKMASFLERLITTLSKSVATQEVPAALRRTGRSSTRRRSTARSRSTSRSRSGTRSSRSGSSSRSKSTRSGSSRSASSRSGTSRSSSSRSGSSSRSKSSRSGTSRSAGSRSGSSRSAASRSGSKRTGTTRSSGSSRSGTARKSGSARSTSSRSGSARSTSSRSGSSRSGGSSRSSGARRSSSR